MFRAGQHGSAIALRFPLAALLVTAIACSSSSGDTQTEASAVVSTRPPPLPVASAQIPEFSFASLRSADSILDVGAAAEDAVEPDEFAAMLSQDGFVGAGQRLLTGGHGVLARIAIRKWIFTAEPGAAAFLDSLRERPQQLIGSSRPVDTAHLPSSVSMVMHEPSGCCHEETPIYFATWQQGTVVWTVRASGPAMNYDQATAVTMLVEFKTRDG
jgi:hypothetical protein